MKKEIEDYKRRTKDFEEHMQFKKNFVLYDLEAAINVGDNKFKTQIASYGLHRKLIRAYDMIESQQRLIERLQK